MKARIAEFDHPGLVQLIHDLYDANQENRVFLHTRFDLGSDALLPYKAKLKRFLNPDHARLEDDVSASKALAVLADYKKALGRPEQYLELMVFFCEQSAKFSLNVGMTSESWFSTLVRVYAQAIQLSGEIPRKDRYASLARLDEVRKVCRQLGWFVGEEMDMIWAQHDLS